MKIFVITLGDKNYAITKYHCDLGSAFIIEGNAKFH